MTQTDSDADLNKAIELSIQQQKTDVGVTTEDIHPFDETVIDSSLDYYRYGYHFLSQPGKCEREKTNHFFFRRTNEDLTVDYFLKSLAGQNLQEIGQNSVNLFSPDAEKSFGEKELVVFR